MRRSISRLFVGLFAAPLMLASSAALADSNPCGNIELLASGQCEYVISGCDIQCTPPSFVAACDGVCNETDTTVCNPECETTCQTECDINPPSFDCSADCSSTCRESCSTACDGAGSCETDCNLDCDNRCGVSCDFNAGSIDCSTKCQKSCFASCQVVTNIDCHVKCTADIEGGCTGSCQSPEGALFCNGQFVDVGDNAEACLNYLDTLGLTVSGSCTADASGSSCSASIGCSAAPGLTSDDGLGALGIAGMMMGVGLVASRRRRRA
jgi:hypothetical protein